MGRIDRQRLKLASLVALPGHISYGASKAALDGITRVSALELGKYNIRVNAVNPTVVMTPMSAWYWVGRHRRAIPGADAAGTMGDRGRDRRSHRVPAQRRRVHDHGGIPAHRRWLLQPLIRVTKPSRTLSGQRPQAKAYMTIQAGHDFSLADKVAKLATGGASGIGSAIVDAYAAKGRQGSRGSDKAPEAAQRKVSEGSAAAAVGCDVTSEQSVVEAISTVAAEFRRIDVLVNSAGIAADGRREELTAKDWDLTMAGQPPRCISGQPARRSGHARPRQRHGDQPGLPGGDRSATQVTRLLRIQVRPGRPDQSAGSGMGRPRSHRQHHQSHRGDDSLAKELWDNPEGDALKAQIPT